MKKEYKSQASSLRQMAEEKIKNHPSINSSLSESDSQKLIHELSVHQIELEMQNEELRLAKDLADRANRNYDDILNFTSVPYYKLSKEGRILELNIIGASILGKERQNLINNKFSFFISSDTKQTFNVFLDKVFASKAKESCEVTLSIEDSQRPKYVYISSHITENGENCHTTIVDITERKQSELTLKASEEQFRSIFENTYYGILVSDIESKNFIMANPSIMKMLGYTHQEILKLSVYDIHPTQSLPQILVQFEKQVKREIIAINEAPVLKKNTKVIYCDINSTLIKMNGKNYLIGVFRDISDRKETVMKLKESEEKFRLLSENVTDGVALFEDNKVKYVSEGYLKIFGFDKQEIENINMQVILSLIHNDDKILISETIENAHKNQIKEFRYSYRVKAKDDKFLWIEDIINAEYDSSGNHIRSIIHCRNINERKQAEKTLEDIIENNPMSIQILDTEGFTHKVNKAFMTLFGSIPPSDYSLFNDNQLKTKGFSEIIDRLKNGEVVNFPDIPFNPHDSVPEFPNVALFIRSIGFPLMDSNGNPEKFVIMHEDFTERKKAEKTLQDSEIKFRELFEENMDGITIFTLNQDPNAISFFDMNENSARMLGYTKEEMCKIHPSSLERHVTKEEIIKRIEDLKTNGFTDFETIFRHKNGNEIVAEIKAKIINYNNQPAIMNIVRDISGRKLVEQTLKESEQHLIKSEHDLKERIKELNGFFSLSLQTEKLEKEEDLYFELVNIIVPESMQFPEKVYASLEIEGKKYCNIENFNMSKKQDYLSAPVMLFEKQIGELSVAYTEVLPFIDFYEQNLITQYATMISKIVERNESGKRLKNKMKDLIIINKELEHFKHVNAELEQFAFIASHNLQEPLRTISNYVKIMDEDYSEHLNKKALGFLNIINDASQRMTFQLNSLLDFSRLGRNLKLTKVDSKKLIDNLITDLESIIITSNASIEVGPMPELNVYENEFNQLFQNLILNAIKFQRKDVLPEILIRSEKQNDFWKFSVRDNGIGIAPKNFEKIFVMFQRLHLDSEYNGSGIGLAFCKKIVELHKGEIWVESTVGQGTTIFFTIAD